MAEGRLVPERSPDGASIQADCGMHRDSDGALWFGAGADLVLRRGGEFRTFTAAHGLPRDTIFQLLSDDAGFLWMATSRAIVRLSKATIEDVGRGFRPRVELLSFDTSDQRREIAGRRSRTPGAWRSRDGRLWFATLRGIVTIDPRRVRTNPVVPTVLIDRAIVDGRPAMPGGINAFPPGPRNLEFHFAGVTLVEPRKAQHRYRLEGFDADWVEAGPRREAYYTNLRPGRYRFRVQASNADGVWNDAGAALEPRLAPHFYQTAWFYGLCGVGILAAVFSLYRARLARLRLQYLAVFAERSRVARELHDSLLQGMSAAAIELGNVRAKLPSPAEDAARRLEAVQEALTEGLDEARRLVWNLRGQPNGAGDLGLALSRLADRLAEGRPAVCRVHVEGTAVHLSHDAQGSLFRIAQEALTNAMRHADARHVDVCLSYGERAVKLSVSDDGCGFDPGHVQATRNGHFGLLGMHERARRLGASLTVDSRPGQGTNVDLVLPAGARNA